MTIGLEKADAAAAMSMSYSSIVWAELAGVLVFHEFPNAWSLAGIVVIIGGTLYCAGGGKQEARAQSGAHNGYERVADGAAAATSDGQSEYELAESDHAKAMHAPAALRASTRLSGNGSAMV